MEATNSALILPSDLPASEISDIHDIGSLIEIPSSWTWLWWLLLTILIVAALYGAFLYWKKQNAKKEETPATPKEPAHERARRQLETALQFLHDPDRFCVIVSDAIRTYLEERFDFRAPDRTTEEFLDELQESQHLLEAQKQSLANFLMECDMVKFAKSEPEAFELKRLHESALQLVSETEPNLLEQTETTEAS